MSGEKDFWDKLSAAGSAIGGALIALMGTWATVSYNDAQLKLQEETSKAELKLRTVQALEKFFPLLVSDKPGEKEFAYAAFWEIGGESFVANMTLATGDEEGLKVWKRARMAPSDSAETERPSFEEGSDSRPKSGGAKTVTRTEETLSRLELALQHEEEGFRKILEGDYRGAVNALNRVEHAYPSFHQVYEIKRLLEREKAGLEARESEKWKEVHRKIVDNYSWKAPPELLAELKNASE